METVIGGEFLVHNFIEHLLQKPVPFLRRALRMVYLQNMLHAWDNVTAQPHGGGPLFCSCFCIGEGLLGSCDFLCQYA